MSLRTVEMQKILVALGARKRRDAKHQKKRTRLELLQAALEPFGLYVAVHQGRYKFAQEPEGFDAMRRVLHQAKGYREAVAFVNGAAHGVNAYIEKSMPKEPKLEGGKNQ